VRFPERVLTPGEEVVLDLRPALLTVSGPLVLAFVVLVAAGYFELFLPGLGGFTGDVRPGARIAVGVIVLAILLFGVVPRLVRWRTTRFVLTTERVLLRRGVLARRAREIPLERVNDVTCAQSIWERLLGLGDLMIESAGDFGQERFPGARHPEAVQQAVYQQMERVVTIRGGPVAGGGPAGSRGPGGGLAYQTAELAPGPGSAGVLDQLERLAALRDRGVVSPEEFEGKKQELLRRL